jgi:hypothetical protein
LPFRRDLALLGTVLPLLVLFSVGQPEIATTPEPMAIPGPEAPAALEMTHSSATRPSLSARRGRSDAYRQTVILWPRKILRFLDEYPSWDMWLGGGSVSVWSPRDELLVAVRALATIVPDLDIDTDASDSDLIVVSGNTGAIGALLDRLRGHPLLSRITEDSPVRRNEARSDWAKSRSDGSKREFPRRPVTAVAIRNGWVTNVVWGQSSPNGAVSVTLERGASHVVTANAQADSDGLYHAYLPWEIRAGDVVTVADSAGMRTALVPSLRSVGMAKAGLVSVHVSPVPEPGYSLDVVINGARLAVSADSSGAFAARWKEGVLPAGAPGFVRYVDAQGTQTFQPLSIPIVNVRRDTSSGRPYGDTHSAGISSIIWGRAAPDSVLVVKLAPAGGSTLKRTVTSGVVGDFSVSVDRLIQDGDTVQVTDGADVVNISVPTITYQVDPGDKSISGTAPPGITTTASGDPHSLEITIGGNSYPITTSDDGEFHVTLTANPYLAGLLGSIRYTTPEGNHVYKPLFAADTLARGKVGDWRADVVLGQPDFSQITPNEVVAN